MSHSAIDIFRSHAHPLEPIPTHVQPVLEALPGIRAVLFDVYGTLVISSSGDVAAEAEAGRAAAIEGAWAALGTALPTAADEIVRMHEAIIRRERAAAQARGIEFPEVDIMTVWREVLVELRATTPDVAVDEAEALRLAIEYEARVNPAWPMPGMRQCLEALRAAGKRLGLVSNAQSYTPHLLPALTGRTLSDLGIDERLTFFSYRFGEAKPGTRLYEEAAAALIAQQIQPPQVLYVGNDMLKDIRPAAQVGFRTALFAGDARSLRLREEDERVSGVMPDLVLTDLRQVVECGGEGGPWDRRP